MERSCGVVYLDHVARLSGADLALARHDELWQVSGRSELSWEETVRLDLQYVESWSLGLDISILARTAPAVLAGRGAY